MIQEHGRAERTHSWTPRHVHGGIRPGGGKWENRIEGCEDEQCECSLLQLPSFQMKHCPAPKA